jgi:hypothetical protein
MERSGDRIIKGYKNFVMNKVTKPFSGSLVIYAFLFLLPSLLVAANRSTICYLSPLPGSQYLSPSTNIIIRPIGTLNQSVLDDSRLLSVTGSVSGSHTGHVSLSDDASTIIFVPENSFTAAEVVTVRMNHPLRTREGHTVEPIRFQFEIGQSNSSSQVPMARPEYTPSEAGINLTKDIPDQYSRLVSSKTTSSYPNHFPLPIVTQISNPASGSIFIGTYKTGKPGYHMQYVTFIDSDEEYLMVLNGKEEAKNWNEVAGMNTDFKPQPDGHLTYFDFAFNYFLEMDTSFKIVGEYRCGNGYVTNPHELRVLANGHALLLGDDPQYIDMSTIVPGGSKNALVLGMVIQELDLQKHVVFQWRSFDHFSITDAIHEDLKSENIDYVHPNALEIDTDGNILLSSRHLDEITKIDRTTGAIMWRWGGKMNQFQFVNDTLHFSHQHSIRITPTGSYLLFDNGNYRENEYSRGVEYVLDQQKKIATQIWQYRHTPDIFSVSMGSIQRLPNGNTFLGWGSASQAFTEVRPDGSIALDARFPDSIVTYRAFKYVWPQAGSQTSVNESSSGPASFSLEQNYPNPFNPTTTIAYSLAKASEVTLSVYDLLGRRVAALFNGNQSAGKHSVLFDGSGLASGFYLYQLQAGVFLQTRKLLLLK